MATVQSQHDPVHCIWMDAGVTGYKLCDRNLQCDQCPFDRRMRQLDSSAESSESDRGSSRGANTSSAANVASLIDALGSPEFPDDRLYHDGHLWVKPLEETIVAVGIDHIAASILGSLASVVLPSRQSRIIHRMPWCWLIHHEGTISLYSPIHGIVVDANTRLLDHPDSLVQDPYESGWLVHAQIEKPSSEKHTLQASTEYRLRVRHKLSQLEMQVQQSLKRAPMIGTTLHDGGRPAETLSALLGARSFFQITNALFSP